MGLFHEVKCGRCDRRYSSVRSRCPYCGARKNRDGKRTAGAANSNWKLIFGIIVLLAIIVAVIVLVNSTLNTQSPESTPTQKPGQSENEGVTDITPPPATPTPTPTPEPTPTPTPTPVVNSIVLNRDDFTLSKIGEEFKLVATISPAGTNAEITWVSEDPAVATVSEEGVVKAVNKGTTVVIASAGGITTECIVRVTASAPAGAGTSSSTGSSSSGGLRLSHSDVTLNGATKEAFTLKVEGAPEGSDAVYSSADSSVATVDANGKVTAVGSGKTEIKVTVNGATLTCIVRVK